MDGRFVKTKKELAGGNQNEMIEDFMVECFMTTDWLVTEFYPSSTSEQVSIPLPKQMVIKLRSSIEVWCMRQVQKK